MFEPSAGKSHFLVKNHPFLVVKSVQGDSCFPWPFRRVLRSTSPSAVFRSCERRCLPREKTKTPQLQLLRLANTISLHLTMWHVPSHWNCDTTLNIVTRKHRPVSAATGTSTVFTKFHQNQRVSVLPRYGFPTLGNLQCEYEKNSELVCSLQQNTVHQQ